MEVKMVSRVPPTPCGVAEYASMLGEGLREAGVEVEFLADVEGEELGRAGADPYTGIRAVPAFRSGIEGFSKTLIEYVEKLQPDLVHIQHEYSIFPNNEEFVEMIKRFRELGSRVVVTMHSVAHAFHRPQLVEFHRALSRVVNAVIVHSPLQHGELMMQRAEVSKIRIVPHGTTLNPFADIVSKSTALSKLGIELDDVDKPIISVPGFIRMDKGLDVMLKSFEIVRKYYDAKLLLVGHPQDGDEPLLRVREFLEKREWLKRDVVTIRTFLPRDKLLLLLRAVDIAVFPYRDNDLLSVSGAFHLAIGSKKPVICSQTPRLCECTTIAPELAVPSPAPEAIAKKLRLVLEGDSVVKECVDRLWRYAIQTSWSRVAKMHSEIYLEVLES